MMNLNLITKYFEPNSILDIGAHLGEFYNLAINTFPNSKIISIEAELDCAEQLLKINPNSLIYLLAKDNKEYNWYKTSSNSKCTGNSIYKEITQHYSGEELIIEKRKGITLKEVFLYETFDLIKLDTQGSEIDILQGGIDIAKKAKGIIIEVSVKKYNEGAPLYEDVKKFMESINFLEKEILNEFIFGNIYQKDILFINKNLLNK